jgi:phosphosulfolactate synthase (CoM biosynthesis protein A)
MKIENRVIDAILKINPNAEVNVSGDDIDQIVWHEGTTPIPKADIEAKMVEVQADYDAKQYQRDRVSEYPNLQEAIHALLDGGDTLTDLQAKRTAIKNKYPKSGA